MTMTNRGRPRTYYAEAIAVAPNGGRRGKKDHPALPIGPEELASTAAACLEAGAAMIHAHVRDRDGGHLLDAACLSRGDERDTRRGGRPADDPDHQRSGRQIPAGRADGGGAGCAP